MQKAITDTELEFMEDFLDPIRKPSVFLSDFRNRRFWCNRIYQVDMLLDPSDRVASSSARGVGKSKVVHQDVMNVMLNPDNYGEEGLLCAPGRVHLDSIWDNILATFENDDWLRRLIKRSTRTPSYKIVLWNGFTLHGRITTASKGKSLFGLHVKFVWIDEGELFMKRETEELQGCLNEGATLKIFGIPNGVMSSYLYRAMRLDEFGVVGLGKYNINKFEDPTFTEEEHQKKIAIYGGKQSQLYKQQILAVDGEPAFLTFPPQYWQACLFDLPDYEFIGLNVQDVDDYNGGSNVVALPQPFKSTEHIDMAVDCGYSPDPTVITLFLDDNSIFTRIQLDGVKYHKQAKFIHNVAQYYKVRKITGDNGEAGKVIWQMLTDDAEYPEQCYKVIAIDFQGTVQTGEKVDDKGKVQPIMERIKQHSTLLLQRAFENLDIHIPLQAYGVTEEIQTSTRHKTPHGNFVYSGIDHTLDTLRLQIISDMIPSEDVQKVDFGFAVADIF